jgi:hypothetical protein
LVRSRNNTDVDIVRGRTIDGVDVKIILDAAIEYIWD